MVVGRRVWRPADSIEDQATACAFDTICEFIVGDVVSTVNHRCQTVEQIAPAKQKKQQQQQQACPVGVK